MGYNITIVLGEEAGMEWLEGAEAVRAVDAGFPREGKRVLRRLVEETEVTAVS